MQTQTKIEAAIRWAVERHQGQWRDATAPLPYITHVLEVLTNLRYVGDVRDDEMWSAAALHDLLEQTQTQASELEAEFGPRITGLVVELTRSEPSEEETKDLSKDEIRELRSKLLLDDIRRMSPDAQTIKLADRLSNLRQAGVTREGKKLARYLKQTQAILDVVDPTVNPRLHKAIADLVRDTKNRAGSLTTR